jgi:hypothetical protein
LSVVVTPARADIKVLTVGPAEKYPTISAAVAAANADPNAASYYEIRVAPGTYLNDFPVVTRPMTIGVDSRGAGRAVLLKVTVPLPNQRGSSSLLPASRSTI